VAKRQAEYRLIAGLYRPPPVRVGDRATCLFRNAEVIVTSWTDAPIAWPHFRTLGFRSGSGLLISDDLIRAVPRASRR
jgi:hypothetical protein